MCGCGEFTLGYQNKTGLHVLGLEISLDEVGLEHNRTVMLLEQLLRGDLKTSGAADFAHWFMLRTYHSDATSFDLRKLFAVLESASRVPFAVGCRLVDNSGGSAKVRLVNTLQISTSSSHVLKLETFP